MERTQTIRSKSEAELRYIIKDAGEAFVAMRGNAQAEGKYLDQIGEARAELLRRESKTKRVRS